MARKRYKPEEIGAKLRQVEVLQGQGHSHTHTTPRVARYDQSSPPL